MCFVNLVYMCNLWIWLKHTTQFNNNNLPAGASNNIYFNYIYLKKQFIKRQGEYHICAETVVNMYVCWGGEGWLVVVYNEHHIA